MSKFVVRFLTTSAAIAVLLAGSAPAFAGQGPPNINGIFGAILNSALLAQGRQAWQHRPLSDYNCLEAHGVSVDQLAANGVGPDDPRVQQMFAQCAHDAANQTPAPPVTAASTAGPNNPSFMVDGLVLGSAVDPDSPGYKAYKCRPSDQFPGFKWCGIGHALTGKFGPFQSYVTILHSDANTAVFILQDVFPAHFAPGDAEREIERLSQTFGQPARILNGDPRPDASHSVIATWGDVTLTPLDEATMDQLRRGDAITAGLLIDFLADSKKSASEGLPVFHLGGGAGYIWAARFDDSGTGRLRLTAANPGLLPGAVPSQAAAPVVSSAPTPAPTAAPIQVVQDPAKAEKERAVRSERTVAAGNAELKDVEAFIKEHPQSPKLLDYIDRIGALSAAVKAGDPDDIERKLSELNEALSHDNDYQQHLVDLAAQQRKQAAQFLGDAIHHGEQERDFLLDYIGKNPLADVTPTFASYVKQLNPALQRADLTQLQPLVEQVHLAIQEAKLEPAFIASQKAAPNLPATKPDAGASTPESTNAPAANAAPADALPITEKNRFIVDGNLDDVEILYNASPSAPHIAQNLRGDFVFAQNQARVCLFGQNPDELPLTVKQAISAKTAPRQVAVLVERCNPGQLLSYDLIATQRNAFLRSKREDALALTKSIEEDNLRKFAEVTAAELNKASDAEHAQIEKIKANIADGAPDGFGVVLLKTGSPNLCLAVGAKTSSHRQLLLPDEGKLDLEMQTEAVIKDTNIEDAFINVQKRQCGAVYASAANLKALTAALARNNIPYTFSSIWNLPADVEREETALVEKDRVAKQEETERTQRNDDQSRLAAVRAQDLSATQVAQQAALRQKYGDSAKAASNALSSEIIAWTKDQSGGIGGLYPAYVAWLTDKLADHWEVTTIDSDVQDFGTASFKNRALDTVFARITLHLRNRMLGDYDNPCFVFGRISDTEFSMSREPAFARCNDEAAIRSWQAGHQFKSEWFASN